MISLACLEMKDESFIVFRRLPLFTFRQKLARQTVKNGFILIINMSEIQLSVLNAQDNTGSIF